MLRESAATCGHGHQDGFKHSLVTKNKQWQRVGQARQAYAPGFMADSWGSAYSSLGALDCWTVGLLLVIT